MQRQTANLPSRIGATDRLPDTRCVFRCIEEKYKQSSSGNMMVEMEWEVVVPELVELNGESKSLAGVKVKQYFPLIVYKEGAKGERDDAKSDQALGRYRDFLKKMKLPYDVIDDENPAMGANGLYADGTIGSEEYERREKPTPEELAQGIKMGKVKVGADGKPEVGYKPKLVGILGRAVPQDGQPW